MNDKELADAVVALGVGEESTNYGDVINGFYSIYSEDEDPWMLPPVFVNDWRVAGALMERVDKFCAGTCKTCILVSVNNKKTLEFEPDSLSRAIIEACVEALQ